MAEVPVTQRERPAVPDRARPGEEGGSLTVEQVRSQLAKYLNREYVQLCHVDLAGGMLYVPLRLRLANSSFIESAARMSGLRVRYCEPEELRELRGASGPSETHVGVTSGGRDTQEWARQLLLAAASYGASDIHLHRTALALLGPRAELLPDAPEAAHDHDWLDGYVFSLAGPIYAGSNEIQRNIIAERMLGLPR